ncbi:MAG: Hsp20/alpha crystallin family protein [Gammaproteobacteria bacterium]|nr:Hsp20/alpha crystallin family protein [Gammaproteobacteria bacterium]
MRTTIYEPFSTIRRLQDEMNRAFGGNALGADDNSTSVVSHWVPAVDIHEEQDRYVISADVPGVDPASIDVSMDNGVLTISGERRSERSEERAGGARRVERVYGNFYRRFALPDSADAENVQARSVNGVLEVVIPKKAQIQPKKIKVDA